MLTNPPTPATSIPSLPALLELAVIGLNCHKGITFLRVGRLWWEGEHEGGHIQRISAGPRHFCCG